LLRLLIDIQKGRDRRGRQSTVSSTQNSGGGFARKQKFTRNDIKELKNFLLKSISPRSKLDFKNLDT
jgi:hypothetical protein